MIIFLILQILKLINLKEFNNRLMSEKHVKATFIPKHDVEENWKKAINFIPANAEWVIYDEDASHDKKRIKIGDGKTNVNDLPFHTEEQEVIKDVLQLATVNIDEKLLYRVTSGKFIHNQYPVPWPSLHWLCLDDSSTH